MNPLTKALVVKALEQIEEEAAEKLDEVSDLADKFAKEGLSDTEWEQSDHCESYAEGLQRAAFLIREALNLPRL